MKVVSIKGVPKFLETASQFAFLPSLAENQKFLIFGITRCCNLAYFQMLTCGTANALL